MLEMIYGEQIYRADTAVFPRRARRRSGKSWQLTLELWNTWNLVGVTVNVLLVSLHVLMFERELDANQPQSPLNGVHDEDLHS
jgi:hypothetical protein